MINAVPLEMLPPTAEVEASHINVNCGSIATGEAVATLEGERRRVLLPFALEFLLLIAGFHCRVTCPAQHLILFCISIEAWGSGDLFHEALLRHGPGEERFQVPIKMTLSRIIQLLRERRQIVVFLCR